MLTSKEFEKRWAESERRHKEFKREFEATKRRIDAAFEESTKLDGELELVLGRLGQSPFADPKSVRVVSVEQIDDEPEDYIDAEFEEVTPPSRQLR